MHVDLLIRNVRLATLSTKVDAPYGTIDEGLLAVKDGTIAWVGAASEAPRFDSKVELDGAKAWLTPGLIDCHTHLVFAGNRADEFEKRLQGVSYEQIAKKGGGILSTVRATRAASEEELLSSALVRLARLQGEGVTTVEIKSGYGLDEETELRMLRVARELERRVPVTISTTFLGAHALPPEFENNDDYIDFICETILPKLGKEKLCDAVDVFCEGIGFSLEQSGKVFEKACALGLPIKAHAEQLSDLGGAALVAQYRGLSADHLEYLKAEDVAVLKKANAVAVLLPAAFYFLNEKQVPPIQALRDAKVPMAVATDCNPGSAPIASLLTAMNQSCVLFGLTPEEALTGVTRHAAQALNLANQKGVLEAGKDADLVLWEINHPNELSYGINLTKPSRIWFGGNDVSRS